MIEILPGTAGLTKLYIKQIMAYFDVENLSNSKEECQKLINKYEDKILKQLEDCHIYPTGYKAKAPFKLSNQITSKYIDDKVMLLIQFKNNKTIIYSIAFNYK